jgi:hypothetical protein
MKKDGRCLILKASAAAYVLFNLPSDKSRRGEWHASGLAKPQSINNAMTKSLEHIGEAVQNPKHSFRKSDSRPKKSLKHRYERRKIKEYLQLGEWTAREAT